MFGYDYARVVIIGVALFSAAGLPTKVLADTYAPVGRSSYLCSQAGVTGSDAVGKISIRHKNRAKKVLGKKSWSYTLIQKTLTKLDRSSNKADKKQAKKVRQLLTILLTCYDARSLPRPDSENNPGATPTPGVGFDAVRPILQANCMGCHSSRGWVLTQEYFLEQNLVTRGEPGLSQLYRNLRGNPESYTPAAMPPSGTGLTLSDIATIRAWIVGLNPNQSDPGTEPLPPGHFGCIANAHTAPSKMSRLTKRQIYNSLIDLIQNSSINLSFAEHLVGDYTWSEWRSVANDFHKLGHERLDDRIDETYLEALLVAFEGLLGRLEHFDRVPSVVNAFVPNCNQSNYLTESCRNQFLRAFGRRVLKSPLSESDYNFYRRPNSGGQSQATYREIFLRLLSSPKFLYHLETDGTPIDSSGLVVRISPREFISRLAYTLWNTIPDNQLVTFAENGTVDSDPAAVVAYALDQQSVKARVGVKEFFDGWLKVHHTLEEVARYNEVNGENRQLLAVSYGGSDLPLIPNLNDDDLVRNSMFAYKNAAGEELLDIGALLTLQTGAPVSELFRTRLAPAADETLRRNYNLASPWNGDYANVPMTSATRAGILTRSGFLLSSGQRNRAIIRGRRVREDILCDTTGLPTNNANPPGTVTNSFAYVTGSTQNRIRALTEQPNTQCASCHVKFINPIGFLLERFDSNGRRRNGGQEVVFEDPPGPQTVQEFRNPFDTVLAPYVNRLDESTVNGVEGLSERIASSTEMHACYTRNVVRYTMHRLESDGFDGCFMNQILDDARTLPMKEVLRRVFTNPTYRLRRLNEVYVP